ncbi:MAG: hypothetical protein ACI4DS_07630 [Eubacterium sp.]
MLRKISSTLTLAAGAVGLVIAGTQMWKSPEIFYKNPGIMLALLIALCLLVAGITGFASDNKIVPGIFSVIVIAFVIASQAAKIDMLTIFFDVVFSVIALFQAIVCIASKGRTEEIPVVLRTKAEPEQDEEEPEEPPEE